MIFSSVLYVLPCLAILQTFSSVHWVVNACIEDYNCASNRSSLCCFGVCVKWWKCKGGCLSDDSCKGGKVCHANRCADTNIIFPEFCESKDDCGEGQECESNQCKPAPRPVVGKHDDELHADLGIVIVIGTVFGALAFSLVVGYCSYRCFRRCRRRRSSRETNYFPSSRYGVAFSASRNGVETYDLYQQRSQRPPPPYDSVTLDSNLEEISSPPPYSQVAEDSSSNMNTVDELQV